MGAPISLIRAPIRGSSGPISLIDASLRGMNAPIPLIDASLRGMNAVFPLTNARLHDTDALLGLIDARLHDADASLPLVDALIGDRNAPLPLNGAPVREKGLPVLLPRRVLPLIDRPLSARGRRLPGTDAPLLLRDPPLHGTDAPVPSPPAPDRLTTSLVEAIAGRPRALHDLLARGSRLPGTRANDALAEAFAQVCRGHGRAADPVALALAHLSPDEAPGASPLEFLPVCGVLALGARAAADDAVRARFVSELHARADDSRFRVRDAVVTALARVGEARGDALVEDVASWMDGYFHAAAVLRALAYPSWLGTLKEPGPVLARLDEAFALVRDAPRAAARYPGHKALIEVLKETPGVLAVRFGVPLFDLLVRWASTADPILRTLPAAILENTRLGSRFSPEVARLRAALDASLPPPRNPDHDFGNTRKRGSRR